MKHWIQAARLRTLPLSLSGIIVGTFIAASKGAFDWSICVLALLTTIGFQVISNFANDYGDGVKGTDNENRIGPERALQSGAISPVQMKKGIIITCIITLLIALALIYVSFGQENFGYSVLFFFLGIASIAAAIKYTVGSNAYGYSGLGDVFVFLFFGLLSVVGSEFLYTKTLDWTSFLPATTIGLLSAAVLNLNNMRDRESDILSNKNTLVVKLGAEKAKLYHTTLLLNALVTSIIYFIKTGVETINDTGVDAYFKVTHYHLGHLLFLIAFIPLGIHFVKAMKVKNAKDYDPELKKVALSTFLFSILFGIGLLW